MTLPRVIEMQALRDRLERGDDVTILDVRPSAERNEWFIPGSIHRDAYRALVAKDQTALAGLSFPADAPVNTFQVTVGHLDQLKTVLRSLGAIEGVVSATRL